MTTESATEAKRFRSVRGMIALCTAVLAAPLAWMLGLNLGYALVLVACAGGSMAPLHLVSLGTLLVAAAGGWLAWREWGRAGRKRPGEGEGTIARSRFLAAIGFFGSLFFSAVIVAQWATSLFLHPCMGI